MYNKKYWYIIYQCILYDAGKIHLFPDEIIALAYDYGKRYWIEYENKNITLVEYFEVYYELIDMCSRMIE